jgi:cell division septal protein FtsQ
MENEVRKLPKKTIVIMIILGLLGLVWFIVVGYGQSVKAEKILDKLGYKNVSDVKVYANHQFVREDINVNGFKYTVSFTNLDANEKCKGFILKDFKQNVDKDLICQKIDK